MTIPFPSVQWVELVAALKRARGANLLRGTVQLLPDQRRIYIEQAQRGEHSAVAHPNKWLLVEVGLYTASTLCRTPEGHVFRLSEFPDMAAFVSQVASESRSQLPYVRTTDTNTEYKPGFRAKPTV
jgi:hypothetical protein